MNITLRAGQRFFINGAVIRINRKATIELLNDATFLLENHVMQPGDATTLTRKIYFAVHADGPRRFGDRGAARAFADRDRARRLLNARADRGPQGRRPLLGLGRNFEAMKTLRGLFPLEDRELEPPEAAPSAA